MQTEKETAKIFENTKLAIMPTMAALRVCEKTRLRLEWQRPWDLTPLLVILDIFSRDSVEYRYRESTEFISI